MHIATVDVGTTDTRALSSPLRRLPLADERALRQSCRGGLSPWAARRVREFIGAHLDRRIFVGELAQLTNLSHYHFSRVFNASFGTSPHAYVTSQRIRLAQRLMVTTKISLAQVAADCRLSDQAHFSRMFRRVVGETPGAWLRQQMR